MINDEIQTVNNKFEKFEPVLEQHYTNHIDLTQEISKLRAENETLRSENTILKAKIAHLQDQLEKNVVNE